MKVLKFKVFTEQEFVDWQVTKNGEAQINQVLPLVGSITGDVSEHGSIGMCPNFSVFVLYWEDV